MEDAGGVFESSPSDTFGAAAAAVLPVDEYRNASHTLPIGAPRKVAILGFGRTVRDCPWQDPAWDLWGMNGFWRAAEPDFAIKAAEDRYKVWFDIHSIEYTRSYGEKAGFGDAQERWLEERHPFPVFMLDGSATFPSVVRFPIEELIGTVGRDYFTSTVAYALAYALALALDGLVQEVGLWGIDLVHDTEYVDQRPCAEYWCGRLEGAGVKVTTHPDSAVLRQRHRYGYHEANPLVTEMLAALHKQAEGLEKAVEKARGQSLVDHGALQVVREQIERLEAWGRGGRI